MESPIILFDGVCNFCNGWVNFILRWDKKSIFKFSPLQSDYSQSILKKNRLPLKDFDSIILIDKGKVYLKSEAVIRIFIQLGGLFKFFKIALFIPTFLSDMVYTIIAKNRYKLLGKSDSCMLPSAEVKKRFIN